MNDNDVKELVNRIRNTIKKEDIPAAELAEKAEVSYNTAKDFLNGKKDPDFRTVIRMIDAADLDISKVFEATTILIETDNPTEDFYVRKYRRLDEYGKSAVKYIIDACTSYEKEKQRLARRKNKEDSADDSEQI
ncbi:helix-turn-helix domain-containing protein [Butyrivibrio sp. AE3004]|uniref:helix-turn-helix domain-containing protein n=1 Tax=Butyrivibrio sp. AE3004 TaxID=1506994 RepID=UPI0004945091|nr:helix-turn-helix transcriptional regulator [Butyrivibrio sp. AE3004]